MNEAMTQDQQIEQSLDEKFAAIKADFEGSIKQYQEEASNWLYGWALDMDQKVIVNGEEQSADIDDKEIEANMVSCPLDGKLTLVHCFEAETFIPIGNTDFTIVAVEKGDYYGYNDIPGTEMTGTIDETGCALLELDLEVYGGKKLDITFHPDVSDDDVKALMNSYDSTLTNLMNWLEQEWKSTQRAEWKDYITGDIDVSEQVERFLHNMVQELLRAWDDISDLFHLLSHPSQLADLLGKYMDNPELIAQKLQESKEEAAKMLMLLQDEARCFLCVKAVYCWIKLLSPLQILNFLSTSLASILVEVILMVVIPGGAILKNVNRLRDTASVAGQIEGSTNG
ncbi:Rhs family protein [Vibrio zhugei]|uniref:Rhs family protein n=1 Tax=Vibrio zhugei TaxID=2479546 RepID=A0ABV7CC51_9VIBR|nr:Rhs family protein [Vibrio zhugei]